MLKDWHTFPYCASVPWPTFGAAQIDWVHSIQEIEHWLNRRIGPHWAHWAWDQAVHQYQIGVAFRQERDRLLFVMTWN